MLCKPHIDFHAYSHLCSWEAVEGESSLLSPHMCVCGGGGFFVLFCFFQNWGCQISLLFCRCNDQVVVETLVVSLLCYPPTLTSVCMRLSQVCPTAGTGEGGLCSIFSSSYAQWEAMTFFLESVINQMFRTIDKEVSNFPMLTE